MNRISKILWATLLIILGIVVGLNSFNIIIYFLMVFGHFL